MAPQHKPHIKRQTVLQQLVERRGYHAPAASAGAAVQKTIENTAADSEQTAEQMEHTATELPVTAGMVTLDTQRVTYIQFKAAQQRFAVRRPQVMPDAPPALPMKPPQGEKGVNQIKLLSVPKPEPGKTPTPTIAQQKQQLRRNHVKNTAVKQHLIRPKERVSSRPKKLHKKSAALEKLRAALRRMGKDLTQWLGLGLAVAVVVMLMVVCIAGVISSSGFGIFFADTGSSTEQTLRTAVQEIEAEYRGQLADIRTATPHDVLEETGTDPSWPEVLALYAVKITTDPNTPEEVTTMTDQKKAILRDIFWQVHTISHTTETRTTTNYIPATDAAGNTTYVPVTVTQQVLVVTVAHKAAGEMVTAFGFSPVQRQQLAELLSEETKVLWEQFM